MTAAPTPRARPRLLFLVTEDWFFASHFLGMARAAAAAGFEPVVATRVAAHRGAIEATGARVVDLPAERHAVGPLALLDTIRRYRAIIARERAALVHAIALKPVILGGIAARLSRVPALVPAPTGLGYLWIADGVRAKALRMLVRLAVRALYRERAIFLFENPDDPREFGLNPDDENKVVIVSGAGVDPADFPPAPVSGGGPVRVAVVARMLRAKGIVEAVEAATRARAAGADIELDLWGEPDPASPTSVTREELMRWSERPGIFWRGRSSDVAAVWRASHVAMLLSHGGEGLPRSLVEAAASGRPILTTDVPGCRAVVTNGVEGFRVPPKDADGAARALLALAADPDLRARMGRAARARFERDMTAEAVYGKVEALYQRLAPAAQTR